MFQLSSDCEEGILAARIGDEEIVGFIRWDYPLLPTAGGDTKYKGAEMRKSDEDKVEKKKKLEEGEITEIQGCRKEYLEEYARLASEAKERSGFTKKRCWRECCTCLLCWISC